jgi:hypothetical protein
MKVFHSCGGIGRYVNNVLSGYSLYRHFTVLCILRAICDVHMDAQQYHWI